MFAAPPDQTLEWSDTAVEGAFRFLKSLWRFTHEHTSVGPVPALEPQALSPSLRALRCKTHETIKKVTDDISRRYKFNTAIAAVMELMNALSRDNDSSEMARAVRQEGLETAVKLLAPIVPHCTDVLWRVLGHGDEALVDVPWPTVDESALAREELTLVVQVNGKKRAQITAPSDSEESDLETLALMHENIKRATAGKTILKTVVVPGRLINVVVR